MLLPKGIRFDNIDREACDHCGGYGWLPTAESLKAKRKGLTLTAVAEKMGVPKSRLSSLEHGRWDWNADLVERYLKAVEKLRR